MAAQYDFLQVDAGKSPKIRVRFTTEDFYQVDLTKEEELQYIQFPLQAASSRQYGDPDSWEAIADQNPIKPPWEWVSGETLQFPKDPLEAFQVSSQDRSLLSRRIF